MPTSKMSTSKMPPSPMCPSKMCPSKLCPSNISRVTKKWRRDYITPLVDKLSKSSFVPKLFTSKCRQRKNTKTPTELKEILEKRPRPKALVDFPPEIILEIFLAFSDFKPAFSLARTCRLMDDIFNLHLNSIFKHIAASGEEFDWPKQARQLCADLKGHNELTPRDIASMFRTQLILKSVVQNRIFPKRGQFLLYKPLEPGSEPSIETFRGFPEGPDGRRDPRWRRYIKRMLNSSALRFYYDLLSLIVVPEEVMLARVHGMKLRHLNLLANFACIFDYRILFMFSTDLMYKDLIGESDDEEALQRLRQAMTERLCEEHYKVWVEREAERNKGISPERPSIVRKIQPTQWNICHGFERVKEDRLDDIWREEPEEDDFPDPVYQYWAKWNLRPYMQNQDE